MNELLLCLARLRVGLQLEDLAWRFGVSLSMASNTFRTWVLILSRRLSSINWFPNQIESQEILPNSFKADPVLQKVAVIIDATEIYIQTPTDRNLQSATWSTYKHSNTIKGLIVIAANGMVVFVPELATGKMSDPEITRLSGCFEHLWPGATVLADRGFLLQEEALSKGIKLLIPPSAGTIWLLSCQNLFGLC
jgi:hypothetical protein